MEVNNTQKTESVECASFWARLASFCQCDTLMVSKFHNRIHDIKGQKL